MAPRSADDPYVYPGTLTLKNRLGLQDPDLLRLVEYAAVSRRALSAPEFPLTPDGFKATHGHLFQDVFSWAGQVRTVGLTHPRHDNPFAFSHLIESSLSKQFRDLAAADGVVGLDASAFAAKAAHHVGELNAIHAFREGNGRTMRLHLQQLATRAGHQLDATKLPAKAWNDASNVSFHTGDSRPLAAVIAQGLSPSRLLTAETAQTVATLSPDGRLVYEALAEKIGRQMTRLDADGKAEMRGHVARGLVAKEAREGPVTLTPEQRRLADAPEVKSQRKPDRLEGATPSPPAPPRRRR